MSDIADVGRAPISRLLSWPGPGEVVQFKNAADRIEPLMVLRPCGARRTFYCVRCQASLASLGQVEMHVEPGGEHQIVGWCQRHGAPEGPTPADVDWIARHQQLESGL